MIKKPTQKRPKKWSKTQKKAKKSEKKVRKKPTKTRHETFRLDPQKWWKQWTRSEHKSVHKSDHDGDTKGIRKRVEHKSGGPLEEAWSITEEAREACSWIHSKHLSWAPDSEPPPELCLPREKTLPPEQQYPRKIYLRLPTGARVARAGRRPVAAAEGRQV